VGLRVKEGLTRRNPPVIVWIARGETAVSLQRLTLQVASPVADLAAEHGSRIGEQGLCRLTHARALEDLVSSPGVKASL
jgi:hypothetical protein